MYKWSYGYPLVFHLSLFLCYVAEKYVSTAITNNTSTLANKSLVENPEGSEAHMSTTLVAIGLMHAERTFPETHAYKNNSHEPKGLLLSENISSGKRETPAVRQAYLKSPAMWSRPQPVVIFNIASTSKCPCLLCAKPENSPFFCFVEP